KILLLTAGGFICIYSVLVLVYAHSVQEVGFRTAFDPVVRGFEGEFKTIGAASEYPEPGDRLTKLGAAPIATWSQFLQAVLALPGDPQEVVESLDVAAKEGKTYVRYKGENWLHTELERPGAPGRHSAHYAGWSRVGTLPLKEFVPSILWFFLKLGPFTIAVLVFWKRPTDASATQFYLLGVVTLGAFMGGYHWARIASSPLLILVFMICAVMLPAVLLHFYFVFPNTKPVLQRRPLLALCAIYALPLGFLAALVGSYFYAFYLVRSGAASDDVNRALSFFLDEIYIYLGVAACWYLACVFCLIHSYRT